MGLLVVLLVLLLPVAELVVIVTVAGDIGIGNTLGLLLVVSLVGAWLAKRAGLGALERLRRGQIDGTEPSRDLADAALLLLAAVLLVLPGFISDVFGLALLLPPVRAVVRTIVLQRLSKSRRVVLVGQTARRDGSEVWEAESWEEPPHARPHGQIGDGS